MQRKTFTCGVKTVFATKLAEFSLAPIAQSHVKSNQTNLSRLTDLPPVKPSAIALGTAFNHAISLAVLGPVFGDAYRRAQQANSKEEYFNSKEAATAAATWGSSIVGSGIQAYGVGALINATGTLTYKGAAYLGSLIFFASAAPSVCFLYNYKDGSELTHSSACCPDPH